MQKHNKKIQKVITVKCFYYTYLSTLNSSIALVAATAEILGGVNGGDKGKKSM